VRRRWLRWLTIALAVLLGLAGATWWFAWRPVRPAAAFFQRLGGESPSRDAFAAAGAGRILSAGSMLDACCSQVYELESEAPDAPLVVVVAGVTPKGVDDPRVWRLVLALHDAGCAVITPQIDGLAKPGEAPDLVLSLVRAWQSALLPDAESEGGSLGSN
jgi:hypothetical protein